MSKNNAMKTGLEEYALGKAVEAMLESMADNARQEFIEIDLANADIERLLDSAVKANDITFIFITSRIFEDILDQLFRKLFVRRDKKVTTDLLASLGPLGSFRSKLDLAFCLGWISESTYKNTTYFRSIRNRFAHLNSTLSVDDDDVRNKVDNFIGSMKSQVQAALNAAIMASEGTYIVKETTRKVEFFVSVLFLMHSLIKEAYVFHLSVAHRVPSIMITGSGDEKMPMDAKAKTRVPISVAFDLVFNIIRR